MPLRSRLDQPDFYKPCHTHQTLATGHLTETFSSQCLCLRAALTSNGQGTRTDMRIHQAIRMISSFLDQHLCQRSPVGARPSKLLLVGRVVKASHGEVIWLATVGHTFHHLDAWQLLTSIDAERIHTGVRPHVCDHPGCEKQFIQRSALTVHARVHTGEKPHMCERCGKPFSDSSSLARHRRIHSGKRPYKCPFADCQKTFTRRTTLTRHQNHHTGTVEEAAAATAAALASRPPTLTQQTSSEGGNYSDTASGTSTPSPGRRNSSLSPSSEAPRMPNINRRSADFSYMPSGPFPHHLRHDLQSPSSRSSPSIGSPTLSSYAGPPPASNQHRPSLTSHPAMYGPPSVLEPPTHPEHRHSGSSGSSPHLSTVGWQSPIPGMGSPTRDSYAYPEPPFAQSAPHLYYPNSNLRRPQSTEPDQYETKPRMVGGEVWAGSV
ncbi:MAG: hypothetical protein Q9201_001559 [Fulgogasparrea decipioides]